MEKERGYRLRFNFEKIGHHLVSHKFLARWSTRIAGIPNGVKNDLTGFLDFALDLLALWTKSVNEHEFGFSYS
jgi:hypothetical protein